MPPPMLVAARRLFLVVGAFYAPAQTGLVVEAARVGHHLLRTNSDSRNWRAEEVDEETERSSATRRSSLLERRRHEIDLADTVNTIYKVDNRINGDQEAPTPSTSVRRLREAGSGNPKEVTGGGFAERRRGKLPLVGTEHSSSTRGRNVARVDAASFLQKNDSKKDDGKKDDGKKDDDKKNDGKKDDDKKNDGKKDDGKKDDGKKDDGKKNDGKKDDGKKDDGKKDDGKKDDGKKDDGKKDDGKKDDGKKSGGSSASICGDEDDSKKNDSKMDDDSKKNDTKKSGGSSASLCGDDDDDDDGTSHDGRSDDDDDGHDDDDDDGHDDDGKDDDGDGHHHAADWKPKDPSDAQKKLIAKFPKWDDVDKEVKKWEDDEKLRDKKTAKLVEELSDADLSKVVVGGGWGNSGYIHWSRPLKSLQSLGENGWGGLTMQAGPQGFRTQGYPNAPTHTDDKSMARLVDYSDLAIASSVQLPANGGVANSWDAEHGSIYGWVMGSHFHFHGAAQILGPNVQLWKNPKNGRNFEFAAGEDPVLGAFLTSSLVRAMTANGCLSTLRNYNYNDWEANRNAEESEESGEEGSKAPRSVKSVPMDASMELFVKPFVAGIAAGSQAVMCGYGEVDGKAMCGNKEKLSWLNDLSQRFFIMTDHQVHNTKNAKTAKDYLNAGLVQEQPAAGGLDKDADEGDRWDLFKTQKGRAAIWDSYKNPENEDGEWKAVNMIGYEDEGNIDLKKLKKKAAHRLLAAAEDGKQLHEEGNKKRIRADEAAYQCWTEGGSNKHATCVDGKQHDTPNLPAGETNSLNLNKMKDPKELREKWLNLAKMLAVDQMVLLKNGWRKEEEDKNSFLETIEVGDNAAHKKSTAESKEASLKLKVKGAVSVSVKGKEGEAEKPDDNTETATAKAATAKTVTAKAATAKAATAKAATAKDEHKGQHHKKGIAEKDETSKGISEKRSRILPLQPGDEVELDEAACWSHRMYLAGGGTGYVGLQTFIHVGDGFDAAVEQGWWKRADRGKGKFKLTCRSSYSAEGMVRSDEDIIEYQEPGDKKQYSKEGPYQLKGEFVVDENTIVFISAPGQVPMGELLEAGAIVYSLYPGQRGGHALADVLAGVYQPTGKLGYTLFKTSDAYAPKPREDYGRDGIGYRGHQVKRQKETAFEFGFGLPYSPVGLGPPGDGLSKTSVWEDLVEVDVKVLNLDVRGIYFCVKNKLKKEDMESAEKGGKGKAIVYKPSPVVQFFAQQKGRDYKELISFRKIRELEPEKTECRIAFYDPVSAWDGDDADKGQFKDQDFANKEWTLYYSLNGVGAAKKVEVDALGSADGAHVVEESGKEGKRYKKLKEYFRAYKERYAAEYLLAKNKDAEEEGSNLMLADLVDESSLDDLVNRWEDMAKRSNLKVKSNWQSHYVWGLPDHTG